MSEDLKQGYQGHQQDLGSYNLGQQLESASNVKRLLEFYRALAPVSLGGPPSANLEIGKEPKGLSPAEVPNITVASPVSPFNYCSLLDGKGGRTYANGALNDLKSKDGGPALGEQLNSVRDSPGHGASASADAAVASAVVAASKKTRGAGPSGFKPSSNADDLFKNPFLQLSQEVEKINHLNQSRLRDQAEEASCTLQNSQRAFLNSPPGLSSSDQVDRQFYQALPPRNPQRAPFEEKDNYIKKMFGLYSLPIPGMIPPVVGETAQSRLYNHLLEKFKLVHHLANISSHQTSTANGVQGGNSNESAHPQGSHNGAEDTPFHPHMHHQLTTSARLQGAGHMTAHSQFHLNQLAVAAASTGVLGTSSNSNGAFHNNVAQFSQLIAPTATSSSPSTLASSSTTSHASLKRKRQEGTQTKRKARLTGDMILSICEQQKAAKNASLKSSPLPPSSSSSSLSPLSIKSGGSLPFRPSSYSSKTHHKQQTQHHYQQQQPNALHQNEKQHQNEKPLPKMPSNGAKVSSAATAGASGGAPIHRDPQYPPPILCRRDSSCPELEEASLRGENIPAFKIGGEFRLCLPQILRLLQIIGAFDWEHICAACEELQIHCATCTSSQLAALKASGILPVSAHQCGLITQSDAERLISYLEATACKKDEDTLFAIETEEHVNQPIQKIRNSNEDSIGKNPISSAGACSISDDSPISITSPTVDCSEPRATPAFVYVQHRCFGRAKGKLYIDLYNSEDSKCVQCRACMTFVSPRDFVRHLHHYKENRTCHWGFDSSNWRSYVHIDNSCYEFTSKAGMKEKPVSPSVDSDEELEDEEGTTVTSKNSIFDSETQNTVTRALIYEGEASFSKILSLEETNASSGPTRLANSKIKYYLQAVKALCDLKNKKDYSGPAKPTKDQVEVNQQEDRDKNAVLKARTETFLARILPLRKKL